MDKYLIVRVKVAGTADIEEIKHQINGLGTDFLAENGAVIESITEE